MGKNACATKEKGTFFNVRKKVPMATKPRGGGAKGLKNLNFFAASRSKCRMGTNGYNFCVSISPSFSTDIS